MTGQYKIEIVLRGKWQRGGEDTDIVSAIDRARNHMKDGATHARVTRTVWDSDADAR